MVLVKVPTLAENDGFERAAREAREGKDVVHGSWCYDDRLFSAAHRDVD
jgi:hypothetical protein